MFKYIIATLDPRANLTTCYIEKMLNVKEKYKLFKDKTNISTIYDIQGHYICMKYYPLGSLRDLIDKGKANKNRYLIAIIIIDG